MNAYTEDNLVQKTTAEYLVNSLDWNESVYAMRETIAAVIVSEEQNEDEKFAKWGLDILPHRKVMKEGFDARREAIDASHVSRLTPVTFAARPCNQLVRN